MKKEELIKLAKAIRSNNKEFKLNFSEGGVEQQITLTPEAMNNTLRKELFAMANSSSTNFERYKLDLFDLITESVDVKMPKDIERYFEGYAQVRNYGRQDKPEITLNKMNKYTRERAMVTQVTSAGVYEVFKLPKEGVVQVNMKTLGGGAQISFEDFYSGRIDWNELINIIELGIGDRIYDEIMKSFEVITSRLPEANISESANFDPKGLEKVLDTVSAYGAPVIFCTKAFARLITEGTDWASEKEKEERRNVGYLADYKDAKIVILPQTFTDETNTTKKTDDSIAYVLPSGGEKPIQVCMQGQLEVKDVDNSDWSKEIHAFKRAGIVTLTGNSIGKVVITSLKNA